MSPIKYDSYIDSPQKTDETNSKIFAVFWTLPLVGNIVPNHFNYEEYIIYIVHYRVWIAPRYWSGSKAPWS